MNDFQLSKHFSYFELTASASHPELEEVNRLEGYQYLTDLMHLCLYILEPLRVQFGPLKVDSGFRCPVLNDVVGGSPTTQHAFGEAADVNAEEATDAKRVELAQWLKASGIPFGQALVERGCLHVSLPGTKHLGQVARAERVNGVWTLTPLA